MRFFEIVVNNKVNVGTNGWDACFLGVPGICFTGAGGFDGCAA